jgi:predicted NBD/HSP70 family sugar kinase
VSALAVAFDNVVARTGITRDQVAAVGLDSPGPASAQGVISSRGATNFADRAWWGFDLRSALEARLGLPVVYNNDGNAAALYAHSELFGSEAASRTSVSVIVGTGLGGGVVINGSVVTGAAGMAGELGHVFIPTDSVLEPDQPMPVCNCGFSGDAESIASLTGIERNLLPYWLGRHPDHPLHAESNPKRAAMQIRGLAERGDPMALSILEQQAAAIAILFTIAANFIDPDAYLLGGGLVETTPSLREWFLDEVRARIVLREEQQRVTQLAVVQHLDMAGARGSALAAMALGQSLRTDDSARVHRSPLSATTGA